MKRGIKNRLQFILSLSLIMLVVLSPISGSNTATARERKFEFEYKATVKDIPAGAKKVELWIPVPHDSPFQTITDLQIDSPYPYKMYTGQYGNRILQINLNNSQQASFTVAMRFNAVR